ncbi:hypothetical protein M231_03478 [Tremella mesenterica]|uniref:Uncharacterized protein n=1 Tax=Tremella mesenterica TaxID=5217 RepID=A0A4Q1BN31_TREME|nr:hypothetical protein M231_03478 [Tremella mesenterica]
MDYGLPYDGTPPPEDTPIIAGEPQGLDMALDDLPRQSKEIPEHVKSLMGRMSKGKVYLLDESPAIVHHTGDQRIRGDPKMAQLATQLDQHDPTSWLEAVTEGSPSPIRVNALFVSSELIKHLSTSKVFTWATGLGAGVMGIEWLNDTALLLVFPTPSAALLGLSLISKAGFDPAEGDDPLLERSAHSFPVSLLPISDLLTGEGKELIPTSTASGGEIRRKGRGAFSGSLQIDQTEEKSDEGFELAPGVDPLARVAIRYAVEDDKSLREKAKRSEWYARHGYDAGKETRTARDLGGKEEVTFSGRGGEDGREFAKRIGKERISSNRGKGRGRRTGDDLDRELDDMRRGETGRGEMMDIDMDVDESRQRRRRGNGRRDERGGRGRDDLDRGE